MYVYDIYRTLSHKATLLTYPIISNTIYFSKIPIVIFVSSITHNNEMSIMIFNATKLYK